MTLRELLEQRSALILEMRSYTSSPAGESGDLSAEQSQKFDTAKSKLEALEKRIERQRVLDDAERRMEGTPLHGSGDGKLDDELRKFSLTKAICSQVPDLAQRIDCGREREISNELAKRSGMGFSGVAVPMQVFEKRVTTSDGASGGDLIATDFMSGQYIDRLRNALVVKKLGARVLSGLTGNVDIPKRLTSSSAAWIADNAALTPSDGTFDKISLTPKHVGSICEFSRNMLLQSSPDIEELVRQDFAEILAEAVDRAAIKGGGSDEPSGLLAAGSGIDTSVSMATPTWTTVLQLIEAVALDNSEGSAFFTDPSVVRKLRSTAKVSSTDSVMIMESRDRLADYPLAVSNLFPILASPVNPHSLIFGKWSDILLGYWSVFDLLVNPYESTAYTKGNVSVRGIITMDVGVRHIESFAASTDVGV